MKGSMGNRLVTTVLVLAVALALGPVVAGTAAASAPSTSGGGSVAAWAYGGVNSSSGTVSFNNGSGTLTVSWTATIGVVVIFNATNTSANVTELSLERVVSVSLSGSASGTIANLSYSYTAALSYHALEVDHAYANVTNASSVTLGNGSSAAAFGLLNASASAQATVNEAFTGTANFGGFSASIGKYLNVSAQASATVGFAPSLGLVPLNLTGVSSWTSNATATPHLAWSANYTYVQTSSFGGGNASNGSTNGSWGASVLVHLTGIATTLGLPSFDDHLGRTAVVLVVVGPFDLYDGFVLIPHGFDLFGGASQTWDTNATVNATFSVETLFLHQRSHVDAESFSAARATFGAGSSVLTLARPSGPLGPAVSGSPGSPGATVVAQPESPSQAQSQANCFKFGCSAAAPWFSGLVAIAVILLAVAAAAGIVGALAWRRSKHRKGGASIAPGGGPVQAWPGAVPPGAIPPAPAPPGPDPLSPGGPGPRP